MLKSLKEPLVVGKGKDMQFNPTIWEQWNSDACDADDWKHGRVSQPYRDNYDNIQWE
jgi:hypothetical protein